MNWIDDIVEKTLLNYNGRKVVIWGYNSAAKDIATILQNHNIEFAFFLEDRTDYIDGRVVKSFDEIEGKAEEYYLIVTMGYFEKKKRRIERGGGIQLIKIIIIFATVSLCKMMSILRMPMEIGYWDIIRG